MTIIDTARQLTRRIQGRLGPKSAILLYHRVANERSDPFRLCVTTERFEEQLQTIRKLGTPVRLSELARRTLEGRVPSRAFCVTFDDGYQDNLYTAKPILERYEIPATVFVTTGAGGRKVEYWWDQLEDLLLSPSELPPRLTLELSGQQFCWSLGESVSWTDDDRRHCRGWKVTDKTFPTARHEILGTIHRYMLKMSESEQNHLIDSLWGWAGRQSSVRESRRVINPPEVVELERGGLLEVGAHTVDHPALPTQDSEVQKREILQSKLTLEEWVGHSVDGFAYPYGLFSNAVIDHVRAAGFEFACAGLGRPVRRDSSQLVLPRLDVFDWSADEFASIVNTHLG